MAPYRRCGHATSRIRSTRTCKGVCLVDDGVILNRTPQLRLASYLPRASLRRKDGQVAIARRVPVQVETALPPFFVARLTVPQRCRFRHPALHPAILARLSHPIPHPRRDARPVLPLRTGPAERHHAVRRARRAPDLAALLGLRLPPVPVGIREPERDARAGAEDARGGHPA